MLNSLTEYIIASIIILEVFTFSRMKFQESDFDAINWTKKSNHCENHLDFLFEAYNDTDIRLLLFTV